MCALGSLLSRWRRPGLYSRSVPYANLPVHEAQYGLMYSGLWIEEEVPRAPTHIFKLKIKVRLRASIFVRGLSIHRRRGRKKDTREEKERGREGQGERREREREGA